MTSNRFSRARLAFALGTTLLMTSLPPAIFAQTSPQPTVQTPNTKTLPTGNQDPTTAAAQPVKATPAPTPVHPRNTAPLAENEDPSQIGKRNINKGIISKMTGKPEKDVALGRQLSVEVEKTAKFIDDPVITEYVNRVGQNIVLHSDAKVPFTIKVIDSDEVNAFALPGGFFYVNKGLILAADNEAELAGVMAHETAHVAARHTAENIAKANLYQYGALASILLGVPPILINATDFGAMLGFMKFSRGAETEADRLGLQYMYAAGYDPNAMATMFEKLSAINTKKPGSFARLFQTHPYAPERRQAVIDLAARFPEREEYVVNTSEFQRVKARLLRMSNASKMTANIPGKDEGNGRPTLKRRNPTPDDPSNPSGTDKPSTPPSDHPTLKRSPNSSDSSTQQPPNNP